MTADDAYGCFVLWMRKAGSMRALAKQWGLTPSYLSDMLNHRRQLSDAVLARMGLERVVTVRYRQIDPPREEEARDD